MILRSIDRLALGQSNNVATQIHFLKYDPAQITLWVYI